MRPGGSRDREAYQKWLVRFNLILILLNTKLSTKRVKALNKGFEFRILFKM
ncbi:hypothetical protein GALL_432080 [mine drainage metagenome]|uniref:Uncharacterized protein n=1 Tax=mine drainage metagenome TaxID=410659 RepID=A0A1J5Q562_9ZZZZ